MIEALVIQHTRTRVWEFPTFKLADALTAVLPFIFMLKGHIVLFKG